MKAGDVVATSGRGGLFPRGLRLGQIELGRDQPVIRPFAAMTRLEFVSVLQFDSPLLPLAENVTTRRGRKR